jgi:hypothetical protein
MSYGFDAVFFSLHLINDTVLAPSPIKPPTCPGALSTR